MEYILSALSAKSASKKWNGCHFDTRSFLWHVMYLWWLATYVCNESPCTPATKVQIVVYQLITGGRSPATLLTPCHRMVFIKIHTSALKRNVLAFEAKRFGVWGKTPWRFLETIRRFREKNQFFLIWSFFCVKLSNPTLRMGGRRKGRWQDSCHPLCSVWQRVGIRWQECMQYARFPRRRAFEERSIPK